MRRVLIIAGILPLLCLGTTISDPRQRLLVDLLSTQAAGQSSTGVIALHLLKLIALGRTQEISSESSALMGIDVGTLRQKEYSDSSIRIYAFRKMGEINLAEVVDFLAAVKRPDIGPDPSGWV